jgi:hypothetical protein
MAIIRIKPGPVVAQDGSYPELRGTRKGALTAQDVGGRYEEATYRGNCYSISTTGAGFTLAAVNLFSTAIGTFQPILAVYNPSTNTKYFTLLQAWCGVTASPLAAPTQTGGFFFVGNSGQLITNAQSATPVNNYTLKASGSTGIGILNVALAGAVGNPVLIRPMSSVASLTTASANVSGLIGAISVEDVAGGLIIPPGGYIGLANGVSNTTMTVSAGLSWEEIPQ